MKKFVNKLRQVNIADIGHLFLFILALFPAWRLKKRRPNMWLVCEYGKEARDNGYWFFRYLKLQHPKQDAVYAIEKNAQDETRVAKLGQVIPYGSLKHWVYYLAAEINISSHKGGKPNAAVCYLLEVYGIIKNKRVFLQHGITKDLAEMFFYRNTKMSLFICGAKPEYDYVCENFGYPKGNVAYTGFARFDNLLTEHPQKKQILVAPTWRRWLYETSSNPYENQKKGTEESEYFRCYQTLLEDEKLDEILAVQGYELVFFPHRNMTSLFKNNVVTKPHMKIETWETRDLQELMMESACMITDYSSTAMDFAYMNKPVIYFQFDYDKFRREHFEEGYFNYQKDGFGPVCEEFSNLRNTLTKIIQEGVKNPSIYEERIRRFFPMQDQKNCERIFHAIKGISKNET